MSGRAAPSKPVTTAVQTSGVSSPLEFSGQPVCRRLQPRREAVLSPTPLTSSDCQRYFVITSVLRQHDGETSQKQHKEAPLWFFLLRATRTDPIPLDRGR